MGAPGRHPTMKDSGVEWLGDVPVHWGCRRLKTLCAMQSGEAITAESIEATGDYPVYGGNGVRGFSSEYTHDGTYAVIGRQGALCGNVHLAHGRFWASEHAVATRLHDGHVPEWFASVLKVMNLNQYSIAAAQPGLSVDRVLNLWAPVPPRREQMAIARFLNHAKSRVERYIRAKDKLIALLEGAEASDHPRRCYRADRCSVRTPLYGVQAKRRRGPARGTKALEAMAPKRASAIS